LSTKSRTKRFGFVQAYLKDIKSYQRREIIMLSVNRGDIMPNITTIKFNYKETQ